MRLFVAVNLPEEVRAALLDAARLAARSPGLEDEVRWVPRENPHLTLKFLGESPEEDLPAIADTLEAIALRHEPFTLTLGGLGGFPSLRRARVLWADVSHGRERLRELAGDIDEDLARGVGTQPESREYRPHVTLGRAKKRPLDLTGAGGGEDTPDLPGVRGTAVGVASFELMLSETVRDSVRGGVRYTALGSYRLTSR